MSAGAADLRFAGRALGVCGRRAVRSPGRRFPARHGAAAVMAAAIVFLAMASPARASFLMDEPERSKNVISFDVFNGFQGMGNMEYQRVISDKLAITVEGMYWNLEMDTWQVEAVGIGAGFRKYTQETAPEGGYMGIYVNLAQVSAGTPVLFGEPTDLQTSIFVIPSGVVGYAWMMDYFLVEVTVGAQYYAGSIEPRFLGDTFPMNGASFFLTLSLGLPF